MEASSIFDDFSARSCGSVRLIEFEMSEESFIDRRAVGDLSEADNTLDEIGLTVFESDLGRMLRFLIAASFIY